MDLVLALADTDADKQLLACRDKLTEVLFLLSCHSHRRGFVDEWAKGDRKKTQVIQHHEYVILHVLLLTSNPCHF